MAKENLEQFYQSLEQQPALQRQLMAATNQESFVSLAVSLGQQHGYYFTATEVIEAIAPEKSTTGVLEELDDAQLEAVVGGGLGLGNLINGVDDQLCTPSLLHKDGDLYGTGLLGYL